MLAAVVAEGVAVLLLGLLVAGLLRSHAEILRALHDLGAATDPDAAAGARRGPVPITLAGAAQAGYAGAPPGDGVTGGAAHDVVGTRLDGSAVALGVAGVRHDTLLAFLSSGCSTCEPFWRAFAQRAVTVPGDARLVVVVQDEESESRLRELAGGGSVEVVASSAAWAAYEVPGSPHFVYVDGPAGRVAGEGTAASWEQVTGLLGQAGADRRARVLREAPGGDPRDNAARVDAELLAAGIAAGHPSLYGPPDGDG